nr:Ycf38 [Porphyropsis coccinea]
MTTISFTHKTVLHPNSKSYHKLFTFDQLFQETKALFWRFVLQSFRRSAFVISGIIQPLLWLILFGALFQEFKIPGRTGNTGPYMDFLSSGIIVFTAFTSSLNAGLPIMFDREFGFFNRLLVAPLTSRFSIVIASFYYIVSITTIQLFIISSLVVVDKQINQQISLFGSLLLFLLLLLLICLVTLFSIAVSFILPGHIELLAIILLTNLPILFSSTALAPLMFMPRWLQIIASINPLTYAIEVFRYVGSTVDIRIFEKLIFTGFGSMSLFDIILYFVICNFIVLLISNHFFYRKLE